MYGGANVALSTKWLTLEYKVGKHSQLPALSTR